MPELPEVETVRLSLSKQIIGKTIKAVKVYHQPMVKTSLEHFENQLIGQTIDAIFRRGKFLIFKLTSSYMLSHLRMEGKYFIKSAHAKKEKHEHVVFVFSDNTTLVYHDVRKFGTFHLKTSETLFQEAPLNKLGLEYDDPQLNVAYLYERFHHRTIALKTALLDQSHVSGIGNIYADEICFCMKKHPLTPVFDLNKKDLSNLIECSKRVLNRAVKLGGSSIRSYTDSLGITGRFQNELNVHLRQGQLCYTCKESIIKIKVGGRGTYLCPNCQANR